jgi:hypothetical protein
MALGVGREGDSRDAELPVCMSIGIPHRYGRLLPKIFGGLFIGLFAKVQEMEIHHDATSPLSSR